jgi:hypothetical protein
VPDAPGLGRKIPADPFYGLQDDLIVADVVRQQKHQLGMDAEAFFEGPAMVEAEQFFVQKVRLLQTGLSFQLFHRITSDNRHGPVQPALCPHQNHAAARYAVPDQVKGAFQLS